MSRELLAFLGTFGGLCWDAGTCIAGAGDLCVFDILFALVMPCVLMLHCPGRVPAGKGQDIHHNMRWQRGFTGV